jgi:hypothetical protein
MSDPNMDGLRILLGVSVVLALGIIYSPWLLLWHSKKLSGKELGQAYPRFAWMRRGFVILNASWVLLTLCPLVAIVTQVGEQGLYLCGAWLASVGLLNGLFAVLTRVCPAPLPTHYVYMYGNEARKAGGTQAALALVYIMIAILLSV